MLAIAATLFLGLRAGREVRRVHSNHEQIKGWMGVPFIAHAEHLSVSKLIGELETAVDEQAEDCGGEAYRGSGRLIGPRSALYIPAYQEYP